MIMKGDQLKTVINGIQINYTIKGTGRDVVLLHGWGSNSKLFQKIIAALEGTHRLITLDMPGFGESGEPPCAWSVDDYVDFVLEFLKQADCKEVILLGHSFGGRVIIKMANRKELPFRIHKIILMDSAGIRPRKTVKKSLKVRLYKLGKAVLSLKVMRLLWPEALEELRRRNGSEDYRNATPVMRQTLVRVVNEDLEALLPGIKAPTLLIWGDQDTATPIEDARRMEQLIPDAGLVTVAGGSHFAFLEQPEFVNRVLKSFLNVKED